MSILIPIQSNRELASLASPQESDLAQQIARFESQRAVIRDYIRVHLVDGTDYYSLTIGGRETKPALAKAGAEKFLNLLQLQARFAKDEPTWEMLGRPTGVICYLCTLYTRSGEVLGEGRGARDTKKDHGDQNKSIKMAEKSAMVDAVLRVGTLSDLFTQDAGEPPETDSPQERGHPQQSGPETPPPPRSPQDDQQEERMVLRNLMEQHMTQAGKSPDEIRSYFWAQHKRQGTTFSLDWLRRMERAMREKLERQQAG